MNTARRNGAFGDGELANEESKDERLLIHQGD
jgi:hypothetical protein